MRTVVSLQALLIAIPGALFAQESAFTDEQVAKVRIQIDSSQDRYSGRSEVRWRDQKTLHVKGGGLLGSGIDLLFDLGRLYPASGPPFFYARVIYRGNGWAFLNGTLQLVLDHTDRVELKGLGSERNREINHCSTRSCTQTETEFIPLPPEIISRLAAANWVELRALGNKGYVDGVFKKEHHAMIRAFAKRYGLGQDASPPAPGQLTKLPAEKRQVVAAQEASRHSAPGSNGDTVTQALSWSDSDPRYDINQWCKRVADGAGGSYQLESNCRDQENSARERLAGMRDVDPKAISHCKPVTQSYWVLVVCVENELKAKAKLDRP